MTGFPEAFLSLNEDEVPVHQLPTLSADRIQDGARISLTIRVLLPTMAIMIAF